MSANVAPGPSRHSEQVACRGHTPQRTLTVDENPAPKKPWLQTVPGVLTAVSGSVVALATIIGTLTPLAGRISDFFQPKGCSNQSGYPIGRWEVEDIKSLTRRSEFSTFIMFTSPQRGTWIPSEGQGSFTASNAPSPHAEVILTLKPDQQSTYVSTSKLVVSADGCRMEGTFADTQNHFGEVVYVFAADQKPSRK
jgi:hypothetical protein